MHTDSYIYTQRDCTALLLRVLRLFCVEISRHRLSTVMTGCIREQETASGELQGWVTSSWRVQINAFFSLCRFLAGRFAVVPLIPQALLVRDVWISQSLACYLGCVCPSPPAGKLTAFLLWNLTLMLSPGWFIKSQSCLTDKQQSGKTNGGVTQQEMWLRLGLMGSPLSHCGEAVRVTVCMSYCLRETSSFSLYSDFFTVSLQRCFWAAENKPRITITIFAEHFIYSESARRVVFSHSQTSRAKPSGRAPLKSRRTPAEDFTAQNRLCVRVRVDGKPIQCMKTTSKKYTRLVLPTPAEHENPSAWRNVSHKIPGRKYFVFVEPSDNVFF